MKICWDYPDPWKHYNGIVDLKINFIEATMYMISYIYFYFLLSCLPYKEAKEPLKLLRSS